MNTYTPETKHTMRISSDTNQESTHRVKQGHSFFGGCCDTRRAVICVDVASCALLIIGFLSLLGTRGTVLRNNENNTTMYSDDALEQKTEEWAVGIDIPILASTTVLRLACSVCGIMGAIHFNWFGVGISAVMYIFQLCYSFIMSMPLAFLSILTNAVLLYPHLIFISEIRKGIMTKENYHNEEQSFCCIQQNA